MGWELMQKCEEYYLNLEAMINEDSELRCLGSGRLLQWIADLLAQPEHEMVLLFSHDNMLIQVLQALGVFRQEWPIYASALVLEAADFDGQLKVRIHFNNEVRRDWSP